MNDNPQLDKILDQALGEYRDAEPLAGLKDRVLQRLRLQPEESPIRWWKWGMVAACAAMLAFAAWLGLRSYAPHGSVAPQQTQARNVDVPPATSPAAETPRALGSSNHAPLQHSRIQAQVARSAGAPMQVSRPHDKGSDLPNPPAPLTGEERQLLALAQTHPDALRSLSQQDQPIAITPLTIQPLPSEASENGDN
jgi:hypothetical protein